MSLLFLPRRSTHRSLPVLATLAAGLVLTGGSHGAQAQDMTDQQLEQPSSADHPSAGPWNVTLGIGGGIAPNYEGSRNYRAIPIPYGSISYKGTGFFGPEGLGTNIIQAGGFRAGPLIGYGWGRNESDDHHLRGLGDISGAFQLGGFAAYRWDAFEIRLQARQAVTHSGNGLEGTLGATYTFRPGPRSTLTVGPQMVFADDDYMKRFFGVTGDQSRSSGLHAYTASGGVKDVALGANSTYQLTEHWLAFGIAKFSELVGDAADSPIVLSKEQLFAGAGLAYHF